MANPDSFLGGSMTNFNPPIDEVKPIVVSPQAAAKVPHQRNALEATFQDQSQLQEQNASQTGSLHLPVVGNGNKEMKYTATGFMRKSNENPSAAIDSQDSQYESDDAPPKSNHLVS